MANECMDQNPESDTCRDPEEHDLSSLCAELNRHGARYVVVGGFAIIMAGYARFTSDVDLLIETGVENETRVFAALRTLPDKAIDEVQPGEVDECSVLRVGDEILVDLMKSACGIHYAEASQHIDYHEINGVRIPFASPSLLWRMKVKTHREKDIPDLYFLRRLLEARGIPIPE
jgi:hypothetical protein